MNSPILKLTAPWLHDGRSLHRNKVLVIGKLGKVLDLIPREDAGEEIQRFEGILCPGFVNAHCHLELSHLKSALPEHTGLVPFLTAVMQTRNNTTNELIVKSAEAAESFMFDQGIVAVGDISNNTDSLAIKQQGKLFYHTFIEAIGVSGSRATNSFGHTEQTAKPFRQSGLACSITPHAPYSVSEKLFDLINEADPKAIISIHNQESPEEDLLYKGKASRFYQLYRTLQIDATSFRPTGKSSLQSWLPHFTHRQKMILVHNTFTAEEDILFAQASQHKVYWCLCPNANYYIEKAMPPVDRLLKHKANIVLGTDSLASNHQLSIFEEIKTLQSHFPQLSLNELLTWATINGAEALGCANRFGSFEMGKKPGVVNIFPVREINGMPVIMNKKSKALRINSEAILK